MMLNLERPLPDKEPAEYYAYIFPMATRTLLLLQKYSSACVSFRKKAYKSRDVLSWPEERLKYPKTVKTFNEAFPDVETRFQK